jgi:hypothetical protein
METWFLDHIQWSAVVSTPLPFALALLVGLWTGWFVARQWDRRLLSIWQVQIEDYKNKLGGASPGDAALRIDKLEKELVRNQRRMLTDEQVRILQREMAGHNIPPIHYNSADVEAEEYAKQFGGCWQSGVTPTREIPRDWAGVLIRVASSSHIPIEAYKFRDALNNAAIDCKFIDINTGVVARPVASDYFDLTIGRKTKLL